MTAPSRALEGHEHAEHAHDGADRHERVHRCTLEGRARRARTHVDEGWEDVHDQRAQHLMKEAIGRQRIRGAIRERTQRCNQKYNQRCNQRQSEMPSEAIRGASIVSRSSRTEPEMPSDARRCHQWQS